MKSLQIIHDYKTLAMPLEMIAKKNNVSMHQVIKVLHRALVAIPRSIAESKKILKEMENA